MTGDLRVDPEQLKGTGSALSSIGAGISALAVDTPLGTAAGSVGQLKTADACRIASTTIADQKTQTATKLTEYATGISNAAAAYLGCDQAAAGEIASVHPGR